MIFGRTELIIGESGAENRQDSVGRVRFLVAPQKFAKNPKKSISKLPKNASDASGHGAPWPLAGRSFSLEVASFAPTYKFSEAPEALRARFFARLGRFGAQTCSPEPPWDAPGLDFQIQNNSFFDVFPFDEHSARKTSNIKKTL